MPVQLVLKVLELATRVYHPVAASAFAAGLLALTLWIGTRLKGRSIHVAAYCIFALGVIPVLLPVASYTYLAARNVYHIQVILLDSNSQPMTDAQVTSLPAAQMKRTESGWEVDVPPQTQSAQKKITIFAKVPESFLAGHTDITLGEDFFPIARINLEKTAPATVRGEVLDERHLSVMNAAVVLPDCGTSTTSDKNGLFTLHSCVSQGQLIRIRAAKGKLMSALTVPAGDGVELILSSPRR